MAVRNRTLLVYIGFDLVFLACAAVFIGLSIIAKSSINSTPDIGKIAQNLLLDECPLTATLANGIFMTITFLLSIPAIFLHQNRATLILQGWLITICALMTLAVGLVIWFDTLQTKANLAPIWEAQSTYVQSMLQHKFQCCGYRDATKFIIDAVCPNAADAARHGTCRGPFSAFANNFLDIVFTTMFVVCVLDGLLLLSLLCILKERREQARYRLIDQKNAYWRP